MKKNMIKAVALVTMLAGSCLQASVTFYNNSDRLVRVEGALGIMYPVQAGATREFQSGLQDTITIKNRDSAADQQYGAYKYRVRRSLRDKRAELGKSGERVHMKKAFFDGNSLKIEGRIGSDADNTMFPIMREPLKTKRVYKETKTKTKTKVKYVSEDKN
jgi:hypothetical protein